MQFEGGYQSGEDLGGGIRGGDVCGYEVETRLMLDEREEDGAEGRGYPEYFMVDM